VLYVFALLLHLRPARVLMCVCVRAFCTPPFTEKLTSKQTNEEEKRGEIETGNSGWTHRCVFSVVAVA
jgi:hypothetical protein